MALALDSQLTFDTLVVGAGNRLAYAAARRVAEAPGTSYNPLFIYSASGLGKTHLLHAIGQHAAALHDELDVVYDTLEDFVAHLTEAVQGGRAHDFREELSGGTLLLIDDVQFLAGQRRMQEELLRAWDQVAGTGGQVVLTSDRPPTEIDELDERLLSRFSGGLIMDVAAPDYETRVAIVRRSAERRGQTLAEGVAEAIARTAFGNVRELQGGLNSVLAVQELEDRPVQSDEVPALLGRSGARAPASEFDTFLADISETVANVVSQRPEQRQLTDAVERWQADGYETKRLRQAIDNGDFDAAEDLIRAFEKSVERLREIASEIGTLEPGATELERTDVLRDPERLVEAEALLAVVRARNRPLPAPPGGPELEDLPLEADQLALKAMHAVTREPGAKYNPLFLFGAGGDGRSELIAAGARRLASMHADITVAYLSGSDFTDELIAALEHNEVESWRARFRRAGALFVDGIDALEQTERAQEELFHVFDALAREGVQLVFGSERRPAELEGLEKRLRSRLEAGLATEVLPRSEPTAEETPDPGEADVDLRVEAVAASDEAVAESEEAAPASEKAAPAASAAAEAPIRGGRDDWFRTAEKLPLVWPYAADWMIEELG